MENGGQVQIYYNTQGHFLDLDIDNTLHNLPEDTVTIEGLTDIFLHEGILTSGEVTSFVITGVANYGHVTVLVTHNGTPGNVGHHVYPQPVQPRKED